MPLLVLATLFDIAPSPFPDDAPTTIRIALAVTLISAATILVVLRVHLGGTRSSAHSWHKSARGVVAVHLHPADRAVCVSDAVSAWLAALGLADVGRVFASAAECALFAALVTSQSNGKARASARDMFAIVPANLTSFGVGELLRVSGMR